MIVRIHVTSPDELSEVSEFYRETGYGGGVGESDRIVVAEHDGRLVGVYRLSRDGGVLVLRGMHVPPSLQRRGIGTQMLGALRDLDEPCCCVPHAYLQGFYRRAGFVTLRAEEMPAFLGTRAAEYRAKGLDVVVMGREPGRRDCAAASRGN